MNRKTLGTIAAAALILALAFSILEMRSHEGSTDKELLFPGLREQINQISTVSVLRPGDTEPVVIDNSSGRWTVASRDDYPADIAKVRAVLLAMADARIVESKTANPDLHGRLGLTSPDKDGSKAVLVSVTGADARFDILFGNAAQTSYRYARLPGQPQTWLVDQNPDIPESAGEWLLTDLLDIDQSRIRQVTITHVDGETIHLGKESADETDFVVSNIPEGRELSYSTVANGIAGALSKLSLEDIRRDHEMDGAVTTEFETFDGLTVTVRTLKNDDEAWIAISAGNVGDANEELESINDRVVGWQFRIAEYKASLLTRNWEDILKNESE